MLPIRPALKVARKRLEKFVSLPTRLLVNDKPEYIHDLRVSSRRLQQILGLISGTLHRGQCRRMMRQLRRLRRDFSDCRSLDVTANLLQAEMTSAAGLAADAWKELHSHALKLRAREFVRARKRLRSFDITGFAANGAQLLDNPKVKEMDPSGIRAKLAASEKKWLELLHRVQTTRRAEELHQLRLAGKRLRYRLELLATLGDDDARARTRSLRTLQDQLGRWHDRYVLVEFSEQSLETRRFRGRDPGVIKSLRGEIERLRRENDEAIDRLIGEADRYHRAKRI